MKAKTRARIVREVIAVTLLESQPTYMPLRMELPHRTFDLGLIARVVGGIALVVYIAMAMR